MIFYIPKAVLIALAVIYREDLGLRAILIYAALWVVGAVAMAILHVAVYGFIAFEALLAVAMILHVRKNELL